MSPSQLPLEAARRLAGLAVRSAGGFVSALPAPSETLAPRFSWLGVALRSPLMGEESVGRKLGDALRLLTLIAACPGFGVQENEVFWGQMLGEEEPSRQNVPSWARNNWRQRKTMPRPRADVNTLRFRLLATDQGAGYARDAGYLMEVLEDLSQDRMEESSGGELYREALEELRPWVNRERLPDRIECGVEIREQDVKRVKGILRGWKVEGKKTSEFRIPIVVEELFFSMPYCAEQQQALSDLTALVKAQLPVRLSELSLRIGTKHQRASDQSRRESLQKLLWAGFQEKKGSSAWNFDVADASMIPVICSTFSSLGGGDRVRITSVGNTLSSESSIWQWLALTVFHDSSPCRIQDLSLEKLQLSMDDVNEVAEVMSNTWDDGILSLLGATQKAETTQTHRDVLVAKIKRGAFIEHRPVRGLFECPLATLEHERCFPVLATHAGWICVQLPGYGHGYVQHSSVLSLVSVRSDRQRGLKSLRLDVTNANAAIALLRFVGRTIQQLSLKCNSIRNDHLADLIKICPHLITLRISSTQLGDISAITTALANGQSMLESLELQTPALGSDCIKQLCSVLADRNLSSCYPLKQLSLGVRRPTSEDLEALLGMLDVNRTLRFLHVRISFDLFESYFPRFQAHRSDCVRDEEKASRTLAFLSAIGYYSKSSSIMANADPEVVAQILAFAGAEMRAVSVEENTDGMTLEQIMARTQRAALAQ